MIGRDDTPEKRAANRILHDCSRDRDELVREFFEWRARAPWEMEFDVALETWAIKRWPIPAPVGALGILHAAVKLAERHGTIEENALVPPRDNGESALEYVHRIATVNGWVKADAPKLPRAMPEVRLPYRDARDPGEEG